MAEPEKQQAQDRKAPSTREQRLDLKVAWLEDKLSKITDTASEPYDCMTCGAEARPQDDQSQFGNLGNPDS